MTPGFSSVPGEDRIRALALEYTDASRDRPATPSIRRRLGRLDRFLARADRALRTGSPASPGSPARGWLLENRHRILETLRQVQQDLTVGFEAELPVVRSANGTGTARILALARHIVLSDGGAVDLKRTRGLLVAFQEECPLTMGELWAFPLVLRVALLEVVARVAEIETGLQGPGPPLRTEDPDAADPEELAGNAIRSLGAVAREDWNRFFEATSRVEALLRKGDPSRVYSRMDFRTRDRYRKVVEQLARFSDRTEEGVAQVALELAGQADRAKGSGHVGALLVGSERRRLERALECRIPLGLRFGRLLRARAFSFYAGSVVALSTLLLGLLLLPVLQSGSVLQVALGGVLAFIPAVNVGIALVNRAVPGFVGPRGLPRVSFATGIPVEWRTAVAVPCLLGRAEEIDALLAQLEMNYLGNRDPNLSFVLLTDFVDAERPRIDGDDDLLNRACEGIRELNHRYRGAGDGPFLLLHRDRLWNPAEGSWMGWERKRGKLVQFNELLLEGERGPFPRSEGDLTRLRGARLVLTLDADTLLPQGAARRLVGTMAHPLNRPRFDARGRVTQGYTVLQPRVEILPADVPGTRFARVFEADRGLDLYSEAVSDVYQDLIGEGLFTGKGLYDVAAFERSLDNRVPDNALLSHDLLEGILGRAGLVNDVVVFEDFPDDLRAWGRRLHRWVRGDWQLLPWLLLRVPSGHGPRVPNRVGAAGRWKILDNLRRSLLAPSLLALLWAGWFLLSGSPWWWTGSAALVLGIPIALGSGAVFRVRAGMSRGWAAVRDRTRLRRSGTLRWVLGMTFLPHQARIEADAVVRTLFRLAVSRRHLLEWTTAAHAAHQARLRSGSATRWREMAEAPVAATAAAMVFLAAGGIPLAAVPLLLAWAISPAVAEWTARAPRLRTARPLSEDEELLFRSVARKTWAFFEEFVGPEDHWLPPDHFQESPRGTPAHRTSPTNVGLTLTSALGAYDLGYMTLPGLVASLSNTLDGMDRLERHRGHLLNWYDTRRLVALEPRYVSTVDSGNLAACLLVVGMSCGELARAPVIRLAEIRGLLDTIRELKAIVERVPPEGLPGETRILERLRRLEMELESTPVDPRLRRGIRDQMIAEFIPLLEESLARMVGTAEVALETSVLASLRGWITRVRQQAGGMAHEVDQLVPWAPILHDAPRALVAAGGDPELRRAFDSLVAALPHDLPLADFPGRVQEARSRLTEIADRLPVDGELSAWVHEMESALGAVDRATRLLHDLSLLERRALEWVDRMDFRFLHDSRQRLFHIGYDVSAGRLDESYYDLLASEARTASYLAQAKGQAHPHHWLQLGRPFGTSGGSAILLSWSGTLFEYLMPTLFLRTPRTSLTGLACRAAISRQRAFAERHRIPWGISESAYHHLDGQGTYQYRAFGVPDLAIRRDVGDRLVVAPYASLLALPFEPRAVRDNVEKLVELGMLGPYGLYEAVDYGRSGADRSREPTVIRSFMAHHQGMILMALANHLAGGRMVDRFHRDPRTSAASYLLHERTPGHVRLERRLPHLPSGSDGAAQRPRAVEQWTRSPDREFPSIHVISNGSLSVLATARGGGGIRWQDRSVTRWRSDPDPDRWGSWIYVLDQDRNRLWSTTPDPVPVESEDEAVTFAPHRAEYRRRVQGIDSRTSVLVPRDANVELRRVVLTNTTGRTRRLRIASYGEPSLASPEEDRRHPAFQKLFVEGEYLARERVLHFRRRRSGPEDPPIHLAHGLGAVVGAVRSVGWEMDREAFLGRGGSPARPRILRPEGAGLPPDPGGDPDTNRGLHSTLDPVHSLILDLEIPPGRKASVTFVTAVGRSRSDVLHSVDRFRSPGPSGWPEDRARLGWEEALHRLEISPADARVAQELLSAVVHPFHDLRSTEPDEHPRSLYRRDALWGLGISGDHPVVLVRVTHTDQEPRLNQVLRFHALWRRMGIRSDLLVLDESAEGYQHPMRDRIAQQLARLGADELIERPGGVYHLPGSRLDPTNRAAVEAVARVRIDATLGSTGDRLRVLRDDPVRLPPFVPVPRRVREDPELSGLPRPTDLVLDNGFGGFTPDSREYVIHLEPGQTTPAPWINVVGTPQMGFVVSERGSGFSWAGNSAENRLTSWSNDPVLDRTGEALYLRDEETGAVWSPTPGPAPAAGAHQCRHGAGYTRFLHRSHGLEQETELFASFEPAAKVWTVNLRNRTPRPRRLTATLFAEWTLGGSREREAPHLVGHFDPESAVLMAENRFAPPSGPPVAFLASDRTLHGWTMDRQEFLGAGGLEDPAGLRRIGLGQAAGGRIDPCAAVQIHIDLEPRTDTTFHFFLGAADDRAGVTRMVESLRESGAVVRARERVEAFWHATLTRTVVRTPEPAMDLTVNRWGLYQALSCRLWARSALYQSAGAFGFRDQLQDVLSLIGVAPGIARDHILEAARHQFREGDVLHWWHPPEARGIRSRCSDDLLWLPFATASYIRGTGDRDILEQSIPFLSGPELSPGEHERYDTYSASGEAASLHEHCLRALRRGLTRGPNGLPLIGLSDWNDGLDRLGRKGRGESVWLAWFAGAAARMYAGICRDRGDNDSAGEFEDAAAEYASAVEEFAWDGDWYLRAVHDDGSPVGSSDDPECQIDSIAQSWSVLSGLGDPERSRRAMDSVLDRLVDDESGLVLLLAPPFDRDPRWPGYIRAYPPGVRENGGQYTHAGTWVGLALAAQGRGDDALRVFRHLCPMSRTTDPDEVLRYRLEPYAVAGDVAGPPLHEGRGGWSWFTGAAAWLHRFALEGILGIYPDGGGVRIDPCIPPEWPGYEVEIRRGTTLYRIRVENPEKASRGVRSMELDGQSIDGTRLPLQEDGMDHDVRVTLGT